MRYIPAILILSFMAFLADASQERKSYQVIGRVLQSDGHPFPNIAPVVSLHGAVTPFSAKVPVARDGQFRFKDIPAGTYVLVATLPQIGERRKTIEVGPSFADSRGRVTVAIEISGIAVRASDHLVSTVELSVPSTAREEYSKAHAALARRDIEGARACLLKAVGIAPHFASAWNMLGTIAYQTRQYQQAEEYFREALKQNPSAYSPLVNLGGALLAQNKIEESLAVDLEAVKAMPGDALAHSQLGSSYFSLGRLDEAEIQLKEAKAIDPAHFSFPQLVLIEIYARKNQPEAAAAEIREFMKLHPDSDWIPKLREALEKLGAK
jgi:tetratricopeptide (TPR) repeat protein